MEVAGVHVEQDSNVPVVLLRELGAPHRVLAIHIGGPEAASIAMSLTGHVPPRPLAHDVMAALVQRLDARVDAVEVIDVRNGTFIAHLLLQGPHGAELLDSRASDAIALAIRVGAPVLVAESVLVAVGALPEPFGLSFDLDDDLDDLDDRRDDQAHAELDGTVDHHVGTRDGRDGRIPSAPIDASDRSGAANHRSGRELAQQIHAAMEREIDAFRTFLDAVEPADFG